MGQTTLAPNSASHFTEFGARESDPIKFPVGSIPPQTAARLEQQFVIRLDWQDMSRPRQSNQANPRIVLRHRKHFAQRHRGLAIANEHQNGELTKFGHSRNGLSSQFQQFRRATERYLHVGVQLVIEEVIRCPSAFVSDLLKGTQQVDSCCTNAIDAEGGGHEYQSAKFRIAGASLARQWQARTAPRDKPTRNTFVQVRRNSL
jgi:hypothetical protein